MKSKFTVIVMCLIILAIFSVLGLLGFSIIQEFMSEQEEGSKVGVNVNEVDSDKIDEKPVIDNTIEKNIEVPRIKVNASSNSTNPLEELEKGSSNTNIQVIDDNIEINKYFYNQLEEPSKKMYRAFAINKTNMQKGNYEIDFGSVFTDILSKEDGQEILGDYYQTAIEAYIYDNPDVFYLSPSKMYLNIETTTRGKEKSYRAFVNCGDNLNYFIDDFASSYEVENAIKELESVKSLIVGRKTGDRVKDIRMVHDYLINSIDYDNTVSYKNIYNIYGALVGKKCVCEGYAKAFKYLLDGLNINNTLVIGIATNSNRQSENHAWNYVDVNGTWYAVDVTWDDPIIIGNGYVSENIKYKYFLKGSTTMNMNHYPSGTFTEGGKVFNYPTISASDYKL